MSLQIWLPLTKDLRQQGLSNVTVTNNGATFNSVGKLGGCYQTDGSHKIAISSFPWMSMKPSYNFSLFLWVKGTTTGWLIAAGGWELLLRPTFIRIGLSGNGQYPAQLTDTFDSNTWYHLGFTWEGTTGQLKLYLNGLNVATSSVPSTANFDVANPINLTYDGPRYLNDFRIYDHCLSPMEVKELAKGLVLHYPLNRQGWGQENLLPCGGTYIKTSPWTTTLNRTDGYAWVTNSAFEGTPGETYTVSVECDGNLYSSHGGTHNAADKHWTFWLYVCNTDTTKSWSTGSYDAAINLNSNNNNYRKIGNTHVWTVTLSNTQKYISVRTNSYSDGSTNLTINWWNMKIEKGSQFTGWCPNNSSTLATTMGLNSTTEYDCSGFCNNGSKMTDTITYTSDTAKYQVSTHFNGTYDGILIENLQLSNIINSAVTYAFWIKPEGESGARSVYFGSYSGNSWSIEKTTGNVMRSYWNGSPDETCSGATITDGVWQHVCLTKSGINDIKVYINGVQKWASTATHSNLSFPTTYRIGRDVRSNDGTPYKGLMSDFRIYATALSADDVKSLYQNSTYIDSSGNVYGAVHSEV